MGCLRQVTVACVRRDPVCCRSSVVEHSLGKGEVESSILSGSTISFQVFCHRSAASSSEALASTQRFESPSSSSFQKGAEVFR
jgi:hypothetical protein